MSNSPEDQLQPHHLGMLREESAIADEVIAARGYKTIEIKADLRRLGFSDRQTRVPALLIPVWGPSGEIVLYQARPDQPRVRNGKVIKYETPSGSRMVLDVHPSARHLLADPRVPLFVTEGLKKGDSLVSRDCCAVALLGVWNWRGTNDAGGKVALADWESIALNGRKVFIVFDSDVMLKAQVHQALARLGAFLERRGAQVLYIYLPASSGGAKNGVDDYLAAGHSTDDLLALATRQLRALPDEHDTENRAPYREAGSGLVWRKPTANGDVEVSLTNFTARITADIIEDDGAEIRRLFEIESKLKNRSVRFNVPAARFANLNWAVEHLGAGAIVYPGFGLREHTRAAIQILSGDVPQRAIYAHTGWREIDGRRLYLHGGGAIGADGAIEGIEVSLTGSLSRFELPPPPTGEELAVAVRASLDLLLLAPLDVTIPVMSAAYLAPLRDILGSLHPDFTIWLHGQSGAFKSELAALAQAHYGPFTRMSLPTTFTSTANAVERIAFAAKDALLVVDDYHPAHDQREAQSMAQTATRLLRGVGNSAGRMRMRADTSLRADLRPRCVALATGERLPGGHSTEARMFPVPVEPGAVDVASLSLAQEQRDLLPQAMAAYVQWLARHLERLRDSLPARFEQLRSQAQRQGAHTREPGQLAHIYLALETWTEFALGVGVLSEADKDVLLGDAWRALVALAGKQAENLASETPVARFLALLADGFASRRAYLEGPLGSAPLDGEHWGWESHYWRGENGQEERQLRHTAGQVLLGITDGDWLLLYPEATYQFIATAARAGGRVFPVELRTLLKRLDEAGLIATETRSGRRTPKVRIGDNTRRVIKLRADAISISYPRENGEQGEQGEQDRSSASPVPQKCSPKEVEGGVTGNKNGEQPASKTAGVPYVPPVPPDSTPERGGVAAECETIIAGLAEVPQGKRPDLAMDAGAVAKRSRNVPRPTHLCWACGCQKWWQRPDGGWVCGRCHPDPRGRSRRGQDEQDVSDEGNDVCTLGKQGNSGDGGNVEPEAEVDLVRKSPLVREALRPGATLVGNEAMPEGPPPEDEEDWSEV